MNSHCTDTPEETAQKLKNIINFLKQAYCIDGECTYYALVAPTDVMPMKGMMFLLSDSKRGNFYVTLHKRGV